MPGPHDIIFQVEVIALWDAEPGGGLRVIASVDVGGFRSVRPVVDGFLVGSDGTVELADPPRRR